MEELIFYPILRAIAWLYLLLRYRSKEERKFVFEKEYDADYPGLGLFLLAQLAAGLFLLLLLLFLISPLFHIFAKIKA